MSDLTPAELDHVTLAEVQRLRAGFQRWADNIQPTQGYSGRWVQHMIRTLLEGES